MPLGNLYRGRELKLTIKRDSLLIPWSAARNECRKMCLSPYPLPVVAAHSGLPGRASSEHPTTATYHTYSFNSKYPSSHLSPLSTLHQLHYRTTVFRYLSICNHLRWLHDSLNSYAMLNPETPTSSATLRFSSPELT